MKQFNKYIYYADRFAANFILWKSSSYWKIILMKEI